MQTLELKSMGLQEMQSLEMEQVDGGFAWLVAGVIILGVAYAYAEYKSIQKYGNNGFGHQP